MSAQQLRVLLVDDEWSLREPLAKHLRDTHGYHVETAANGKEALTWVEEAQGQFDVALIDDLLMPGPDLDPEPLGIKLMADIKARYPDIEFILFTGWGMDSGLKALRAGAYRYLAKPLNLEELAVMIKHAAEYRRLKGVAREKQILEQLMESSTVLLGGLGLQDVLDTILRGVHAIGFDRVRLYLLSQDRQFMLGKAQAGMDTGFVGLEIPVADDVYMQAILDDPRPQVFERGEGEPVPYEQELAKEEVNQWACVPLLLRGEVIGKLSVDNKFSGQPIVEAELGPVALFASQAAAAIENAHLMAKEQEATQKAEQRARNLETLQNLALTVSSSLELDETLKAACRAAVEFFSADHSGLVLFGPDYAQGEVKAEYPATGTLGTTIPLREVPAEEGLIKTRQPLVIYDVAGDKSLGAVRNILLGLDIQSILIVPVVGKDGRVLGSFSLDAVGHLQQFTAGEVELCKVFAAHVAVAIENARLFSRLSETKERLDALIGSSFDAVIAINQDRKITVFNQQAEEMFSWTREEMLGQSVARLHMDIGKAKEIFEAVNSHGAVTGWNVDLKHRDDARIPALLSATLIRDDQGDPIGQAGFMRDLRQVTLMEERQRALIQVSQAITGTLELDEVLNRVVEHAMTAFPAAEHGSIHLYDEKENLLRLRVSSHEDAPEATADVLIFKVGEGIAGWVYKHGQAVVIDDVQEDSRYKRIDYPEAKIHKSMICVPLRVKERVIGTLSLTNATSFGAFKAEDLGLLPTFADQAAIAIDNARRMQELEQMRQAAEAMSRTVRPRQALQQIVGSAAQVLEADSAAIWSYDEVRNMFIPEELVAVGIPDDEVERFREEELKPGRTADRVMHEGYVTVEDVLLLKYDFLGPSTRELFNRIGVRSFQGITLRVGGERVGVLYANYNRPRTFSEDDEGKLRTFASHAALALKNARLLAQMQRTRDAAGVIAGVTVQEDLGQTLKTSARHTQRVLHSDAVTLYSYDEATGQFGKWAKEVADPRDPNSARPPDKLRPNSVIWSILDLTESPYYCLAEDHVSQHELLGGHFVQVEGIRAAIGIQLRAGERKVGVMFINFRSPHRFTSDEIATIQLFADQAAVAIRNARQYAEIMRDANLRQGLLQAGQGIMALQEPKAVLQNVVNIMQDVLACDAVTLYSYDETREEIGFPAYVAGELHSPDGLRELGYVSKDSVVGQLLTSREPHFADDAPHDLLMSAGEFVAREEIKSSAGIPLKSGDQVIGIVFVNYRTPHPFDPQEREALLLFATQAALAIQNARQYEELRRTKGLVGARTALAWMGMVSSAWRHAVDKHALTIREQTQLLGRDLQRSLSAQDYAAVSGRLGMIERLTAQILKKPMIPPLAAEEGVESVAVNDLVRERVRQLRQREPYQQAKLLLDLRLDSAATVRASPEWLRRALDILVDNAVEAMAGRKVRRITISTEPADSGARIAVTDTGPGVPAEVQARLFERQVEKPEGAKGFGIGLLIAQAIVQTYGGDIRLESTGPTGTTIAIWLPLAT